MHCVDVNVRWLTTADVTLADCIPWIRGDAHVHNTVQPRYAAHPASVHYALRLGSRRKEQPT